MNAPHPSPPRPRPRPSREGQDEVAAAGACGFQLRCCLALGCKTFARLCCKQPGRWQKNRNPVAWKGAVFRLSLERNQQKGLWRCHIHNCGTEAFDSINLGFRWGRKSALAKQLAFFSACLILPLSCDNCQTVPKSKGEEIELFPALARRELKTWELCPVLASWREKCASKS